MVATAVARYVGRVISTKRLRQGLVAALALGSLALAGNAGHAIVKGVCSAAISASATGPMFPFGVESKVEQYLK